MNVVRAGLVGASLALFTAHASLADNVVDLRGKQGIVKDLKQHDPKPPRVERSAPPSPAPKAGGEHYTVEKSSPTVTGSPPNGGNLPPPTPRVWVEPQKISPFLVKPQNR